jgi:hypothetical protein
MALDIACSSALPEMLFHLAQDIAAGKAEIGKGAVIEGTQLHSLARPAIPFEKRPETPSEEPGANAGGAGSGGYLRRRNCSHTLHLRIKNCACMLNLS